MNMDIAAIGLETASILLIVGLLIGSQILFTRILLKNVQMLFVQLDNNIAEAVSSVIESKISENTTAPPPGLQFLMGLLENAKKESNIPRDKDGTFTVINKLTEEIKDAKKKDTSS